MIIVTLLEGMNLVECRLQSGRLYNILFMMVPLPTYCCYLACQLFCLNPDEESRSWIQASSPINDWITFLEARDTFNDLYADFLFCFVYLFVTFSAQFVEKQEKHMIEKLLPDIMPPLIEVRLFWWSNSHLSLPCIYLSLLLFYHVLNFFIREREREAGKNERVIFMIITYFYLDRSDAVLMRFT